MNDIAQDGTGARRDDLHFGILRAIAQEPDHSQRSLARAVGASLGAVNAAVNALVAAGMVATSGLVPVNGQLRLRYRLTPEGDSARRALAPGVLMRQKAAYDALGREIEALERELRADGLDDGPLA